MRALLLSVLFGAPSLAMGAPSAKDTIALLLKQPQLNLPTSDQTGCSASMGTSVGEYVAFLLGTLADSAKSDVNRITAGCEKPKKKGQGAECEFWASSSDKAGESPWHYGLKFRLTADGKSVDPGSLKCPGTP